jgi:hypothetical protein
MLGCMLCSHAMCSGVRPPELLTAFTLPAATWRRGRARHAAASWLGSQPARGGRRTAAAGPTQGGWGGHAVGAAHLGLSQAACLPAPPLHPPTSVVTHDDDHGCAAGQARRLVHGGEAGGAAGRVHGHRGGGRAAELLEHGGVAGAHRRDERGDAAVVGHVGAGAGAQQQLRRRAQRWGVGGWVRLAKGSALARVRRAPWAGALLRPPPSLQEDEGEEGAPQGRPHREKGAAGAGQGHGRGAGGRAAVPAPPPGCGPPPPDAAAWCRRRRARRRLRWTG